MLYFNFVKTLVEKYDVDEAKEITHTVLFGLALERSDEMRNRASELGINCTVEAMNKVTDIAFLGWDESKGKDPYGEQTPCPPQRCELSEVMGWYKTCLKLSDSLI